MGLEVSIIFINLVAQNVNHMENTVDDLLNKTFIKLRSDYGFKRAFASEEHSEVLKKFLNALFEGEMEVTDITFQNKEVLPADPNGKRLFYDAYCTTSTGYHFVVEMQQKQSKLFGKRMVFYISSCIFRQGVVGRSYEFEPVYLIVITDFDMKPFEKRLINEVVLMEKKTHIVFSEDFRIYFLSLAQVSSEWDNCKTELEKRLYLIKNMENLNKKSKPYLSGEFEEMFDASEIASMAQEDIVEYRNSILMEMEKQSELNFAKEEGLMIGKEEGIKIGEEKGKMEVALQMKKKGMSLGDIMLFTGLTKEQISLL